MADDAAVEVAEEGVVTIEVDAGAGPGPRDEPTPEPKVAADPEPKPEPKKTTPRVRPLPEDTAQKALQEALDPWKRRAEAAEATAAAERQRAEQADRQRAARETELQDAHDRLHAGQLARINDGIDAATKAIAANQGELKAAMEAGNFEKAAEVQTRLAKATAALDRWEASKEDFDSGRTKQPVHEGRVETAPPPAPAVNAFEQYVAGFTPAAQTWLRAHPECVPAQYGGRQDMNNKMMAGHYSALSQGYAPNSAEYFRVIEENIGAAKKAETVAAPAEDEVDDTPAPAPKKQARPSAPPSREPPGSPPNGGTRTVRLSKDEQEMAKLSFPHLKSDQERYAAYARNKLELEAEGKLGRTTH